MDRQRVSLTTDASGDVTAYTAVVSGTVRAIVYTKTDFANGVDFTVTGGASGIAIWTGTDVNASTTVMPRGATHGTTGTAALYAAAGTGVFDGIPVAGESIKVVVAQGGNVKSGVLDIYIAD
jgi:hypothetical protein